MPKYKPTIQRGISDEGPISSNFLKPEEYDELPVKSHAIITPELVPKSPSREISTPVVKRTPNASVNRRNVCLDLKTGLEFQLSKTDSLAAFLKYENDLNTMAEDETNILSEKELKDKSNSLNKRSFSRTPFADLLDSKIDGSEEENVSPVTNRSNSAKLLPIGLSPTLTNKQLDSVMNLPHYKQVTIEENTSEIDSKLINSCDNLKISNISKLCNESMSSSSVESNETMKQNKTGAIDESVDAVVTNSEHNSIGKENMLNVEISDSSPERNSDKIDHFGNLGETEKDKRNPKRQLQLRKDNLLFDDSSTSSPEHCTDTNFNDSNNNNSNHSFDSNANVMIKDSFSKVGSRKNSAKSSSPFIPLSDVKEKGERENKLLTSDTSNIEALFDDFDLEEFISQFKDNEQFPIFKNYKELGSNRSYDKLKSTGSESASSDESSLNENKFNANENFINANYNESVIKTSPKIPINYEKSVIYSEYKKEDVINKDNDQKQLDDQDNITKPLTPSKEQNQLPDYQAKAADTTDANALDENAMSPAERELLASVNELSEMCDSKSFELNSGDELTSIDTSPYHVDSAYGR